jgi:hypothetical protein
VRTLIYSMLLEMRKPERYTAADLDAMFDLWARHLRGPGRYDGDILIISNRANFANSEVEAVPIHTVYERIPDTQTARVLNHPLVPSELYDSILYLDLDILAVNEIHSLFAQDECMWVSPSNLRILAPQHTWPLLNARDKIRYGVLSRRRWRELGVSSCVFSTSGQTWTHHMSTWAELITKRLRNHSPPLLAEQPFLNLAYLKGLFPMKVYSRDKILHRNWNMSSSPILWHFAGCSDRPNLMRRYSRLSPQA